MLWCCPGCCVQVLSHRTVISKINNKLVWLKTETVHFYKQIYNPVQNHLHAIQKRVVNLKILFSNWFKLL